MNRRQLLRGAPAALAGLYAVPKPAEAAAEPTTRWWRLCGQFEWKSVSLASEVRDAALRLITETEGALVDGVTELTTLTNPSRRWRPGFFAYELRTSELPNFRLFRAEVFVYITYDGPNDIAVQSLHYRGPR